MLLVPILTFDHINYTYHSLKGETKTLENISFSIEKGEFVCIIGPSGCGKSTLLSLLSGILSLQSGEIYYNNNPLSEDICRSFGYMLQKDHLFSWRTIEENILLGLEIQHKKTPENLAYTKDLLKTYGLYDFKNSHPCELSGGMRQRAALIRTLVLHPSLLLLDEPFSALDYQTRLLVSNDIGKIIQTEHKTAILVTHDLSEAISLGNKIVILSKRPGTVKKILPLDFPKELSPMERRNHILFKDYFDEIWRVFDRNDQ